ncbi:MAG TPA: hypothetical protein ENJ02_05985 [Chloroflexi bacterium]|nr:hypothetical protein [Chloroflexota bacterium]
MTPRAARERANNLLVGGLSLTAWHVIDILAQTGAATLPQLGVSRSAMIKYGHAHIVARLHIPPKVVRDELRALLPGSRIYTLGPVGLELAKMRGLTPSTGHMAYPLSRVMHDVILTEILLRISRHAAGRGWSVTWIGTAEAALFTPDRSREVLEPDALLRLTKDGEERLFALEYHNEDKRSRAERKVDQYEAVCAVNAALWMEQWETAAFPTLLAVFRHDIVGKGYVDKLSGMQPQVRYYGKLLSGVLQGNLDQWLNLSTRKKENIFP